MKEICKIIGVVLFFSVCAFVLLNKIQKNIEAVFSADNNFDYTIILDAGHGGEDSGAVAFDGTKEKDINLSITNNIALFFEIFGVNYIPTRITDRSLGNSSLGAVKERKTSDILTRYNIVNSTPRSYLLSIHQNKFTVEKYSGAQVFYSGFSEEAKKWAQCIQNSITCALQPENSRKIKKSDDNIYLLYKAKRPSVLVECGFLSNFEELAKLKNNIYQAQIAYFICVGALKYFQDSKG